MNKLFNWSEHFQNQQAYCRGPVGFSQSLFVSPGAIRAFTSKAAFFWSSIPVLRVSVAFESPFRGWLPICKEKSWFYRNLYFANPQPSWQKFPSLSKHMSTDLRATVKVWTSRFRSGDVPP
jgi:hypothetical protein